MINELERVRKEAFLIYEHLLGGTEKNYEKSVRIAGVLADIQTRDLQNTKQKS
jgi:hypothetical protein